MVSFAVDDPADRAGRASDAAAKTEAWRTITADTELTAPYVERYFGQITETPASRGQTATVAIALAARTAAT